MNLAQRGGTGAQPVQDLWRALQIRLQGEMEAAAYKSWIEKLDVREDGAGAMIVAPNRFVAEWVQNNMGYRIRTLWSQLDPEARVVTFGVASPLSVPAAGQAQDASRMQAVRALSPMTPATDEMMAGAMADGEARAPRAPFGRVASFDNFIAGPSNEFALSAARAVARGAGPELNPLFIHGSYGFGKTHLLHAVQQAIEAGGGRTVQYYSGERFTSEFVQACHRRDTAAFKARVRGADVLLIDDIQMVEGKKATQEEFFHTVADMVHSGRQVIVTAASPLAELEGLDDRTRSLLGGGVRCDIGPADLDLRRRILDRVLLDLEARYPWLDMPVDSRGFLAARVTNSPRELMGALNTLIARAAVHKRRMSIDWVTEVLTRHVAPEQRRVSVDQIQKAVAQYFDLRVAELLSRRRTRAIAVPRQIAMYLAKELTTRSYPDLARRFGGRDHTTVIHGVRRIASLMEADPGLAETVASIRRTLEQ